MTNLKFVQLNGRFNPDTQALVDFESFPRA